LLLLFLLMMLLLLLLRVTNDCLNVERIALAF
jgi:hypothetical protein